MSQPASPDPARGERSSAGAMARRRREGGLVEPSSGGNAASVPAEARAAALGRGMGAQTRLRSEIQVLRAVAVLSVVGNHLFPHAVTGGYLGVDVFFVISGYLITSHLKRELDESGGIRFGAFYARRARRLIPASAVVLATCVVVTLLAVPRTLWQEVMRQIVSSALFVQNWTLAHDSQDYFRSAESPSPVTHYWSLSLEEQFYLLWPLLAFVAYAVGRRFAGKRLGLVVAFGVVVLASLTYSVLETAHHPHPAYFVTPARMWQLGLGGLLALAPSGLRAGRGVRRVTAGIGWAAILGSVLLFTEAAPVPGWVSLVPVLGVCFVLHSGDAFMTGESRPARTAVAIGGWFGAISYSLYLWHWPLIVLIPYVDGHPLTTLTKIPVLLGSVGIAYASTKLVEDPVRRWRPLASGAAHRSLLPAGVALGLVVVGATTASHAVGDRLRGITDVVTAAASSQKGCFGAKAIADGCPQPHRLRYHDSPLLTRLTYPDRVHGGQVCLQEPDVAAVMECDFGASSAGATKRVALVGDSHSRHWSEAIDALAAAHHWQVVMLAKGSCPYNDAAVTTTNFPEYADSCHRWVDAVTDKLVADDSIDVVFTSSYSRNYRIAGGTGDRAKKQMIAGYRHTWRRLTRAGKKVVVLGDVPQPHEGDVPTCVSEAGTVKDPCSVARGRALTPDPLLLAARGAGRGVIPVDLHRFFCDARRCHVVVGGVVAYADDNHMIGFFARTLAPYVDRVLGRRLSHHG